MGFRRAARWIASIAFLLMVAPVIGDFFSELARENGFYEHPTRRVQGVLAWAQSVFGQQGFYWVLFFSGGLMVGVWIDYLLRQLGQPTTKRKSSDQEWESAYRKVRAMQKTLAELAAVDPCVVPQNLPYELWSLQFTLIKVGLDAPLVPLLAEEETAFLRLHIDYLNGLAPFMRDKHKKEAKVIAKNFAKDSRRYGELPPQLLRGTGAETQP